MSRATASRKRREGKCICGAEIEWRKSGASREPFNKIGTSHFTTCPFASASTRRRILAETLPVITEILPVIAEPAS